MKRITITEPGKVVIDETEMPVRKDNEALIKILYGGICGSDLGTYRGSFAYVTYPRTPGHEFSAEIVEIGENDRGLEKGMLVTANPYFNCGNCHSCRNGHVNCCMDNQTMGVQREGAFSEYISIPIDRIYGGKGLNPKTLALVEPFCIGYHGIKRAGVKKGEKVLVIGAGTIGVLAAVSAIKFGCEVTIADIAEEKLEYAKQFGIKEVIKNDSPEYFNAEVLRITGGSGFDVTVEAVGLPSTFQNCMDAVVFAGKVIVIGVGKQTLNFDYTIIQKKELNIYGSRNALREDFEEIIEMMKKEEALLEKIVTNEYDWLDAPEAWKDFDENGHSMLKVMLRFG